METYAIIETTTTLDKVKDLVSKMNDFNSDTIQTIIGLLTKNTRNN